ncbi:MAG: hypothetical protein QN200_01315 [Armatimonadota bacterium]|nr:hypothetical protein [Armatimonadota bacterium]MDR7615002.1 hypothetical protein [Armatimonadota bacterium]
MRRCKRRLAGRVPLTAGVIAGLVGASALAAHAFVINLGGPAGYRARIEVTQVGLSQLKIVVTNLTTLGMSVPLPTGVSGGCPQNVTSGIDAACRLLTSFGYTPNAISQNITGGSAKIATGSTGKGDKSPFNYSAGDDWSAEWGFGNNAPMDGTGNLDFLSTNASHMTRFATSPNRDGPAGLDGPQGGLLSRAFTGAGGLGFVQDTLEFLVNYSANLTAADLLALQNATWWVEFGSSGYFLCVGPDPRCPPPLRASEPGSLALMGTALAGVLAVGGLRRKHRA